ncbi:endonuclease MutS2 [Athalassotoga saccharophila]|uniref:endonuclease MutS2 n=1 Tax=Athalassotoga saccharophila TaxID=1441386 RepID=UPI00137B45D4|nr:Smr/MutS family protein [Athalassotoga saccharophila]BBJ28906.1 endonuclease MutS2 [Athalassotoga saccharophila]
MKVDRKTLEELEFYTFLDTIKSLAFSPYGRKYFDKMNFEEKYDEVYEEVREITEIFDEISSVLYPVEDVEKSLKSVMTGKRIDSKELIDFSNLFKLSKRISTIIADKPHLKDLAVSLTPFNGFIEYCDRTFNPDGTIKDTSSPELMRIRKEIRSIEHEIEERIKALIAEGTKSGIISEGLVIQRHDRYVLPIDASKRSAVKGIIHGQSSTGLTYYIEPEEMIELNDALAIARSKESIEISKIMDTGIKMISKNASSIISLMENFEKFDAIYAKASYGIKNSCVIPSIREDGVIKIERGRNPLIDESKVVPVDVEIRKEDRVIIISGPNMGGKTAFLKTIGLFSLMCALGIPVPASNGTELSIFDAIYSDIGDNQSVKNELSTFSARVIREDEICKFANEKTLILIDEIGEGTEPSEGSAFAKAIIEILISKGAKVFVTTHLPDLKSLAYTLSMVRNASVGFDIEKMAPTYRIHMDMPGRSRALKIIERIGVSSEIIEGFKKHRSTSFSKEDLLIEELQSRISEYDIKISEINKKMKELNEKEIEYEKKFEKLKAKELAALSEEIRKLSDEISKTKKELEEAIHDLRSSKEESELASRVKKLNDLRKEIENSMMENAFSQSEGYARIKGTNVIGKIKSLKKDTVVLDVNGSNVEISSKMIEMYTKPKTQEEKIYVKEERVPNEIDVRGMTVEEAIPVVEEFIEHVIRSNSVGFIIHGKGTGKLANGIWSFLRSKHVNFRIGREGEGGTGVTVIGEDR